MVSKPDLDDELRRLGRREADVEDDGMRDRVLAEVFHADTPRAETRVARFTILRTLGRGGMGAVYAAHDPELQREVALKLLASGLGSHGRRRRIIEAEARALARLAHQNVVRVFELGEHEGELFVVMELIEGIDLRAWCGAKARLVGEIIASYVQAGRGLAAAHRAGLVHRDFKPANVLVGNDDVVRVVDFGLALADDAVADGLVASSGSSSGDGSSTPFGVGTFAYMAPEQLAFGRADARADQFSFCVSLYEALTGRLPFPGGRRLEMADGADLEGPSGPGWSGMPRWIARILRRGMQPQPSARWPTMDALTDALEQTPRRRRRVVWGAVVVTVLLLATLTVKQFMRPSCDPTDALAAVWDERTRGALVQSAPTAPQFAATALGLAAEGLDDYAARWRDAQQWACEATWTKGTRTPRALDEATLCLDMARLELATAVELLAAGRVETIARATDVVARIRDPSSCLDPDGVEKKDSDRDRVLDGESGRARVLLAAGRPTDALEVVEGIGLTDADVGAHAARAWLVRGEIMTELARFPEAESAMLGAATLSQADGNERTRLAVVQSLARFYGYTLPDVGRMQVVEALLEGIGRRVELGVSDRAAMSEVAGALAAMRGDTTASIAHHRGAVASLEGSTATDPVLLASYRKRLGAALQRAERYSEAKQVYDSTLDDLLSRVGPTHPAVADLEQARGSLALEENRRSDARLSFARALAIYTDALGETSVRLATPLTVLAELAASDHDYVEAERLSSRAWRLQQELPVGHPDRGMALAVLAGVHAFVGRHPESLEEHQQVIRELGAQMSPALHAAIDLNTGWLLCRLDRCPEARSHLERAMLDADPESVIRLHADAALAEVELAENRPFAALERAERLLRDPALQDVEHAQAVAELRSTRALALAATSSDRREIREAAAAASVELERAQPGDLRVARLERIAALEPADGQ